VVVFWVVLLCGAGVELRRAAQALTTVDSDASGREGGRYRRRLTATGGASR
jgi:hypothetical protein